MIKKHKAKRKHASKYLESTGEAPPVQGAGGLVLWTMKSAKPSRIRGHCQPIATDNYKAYHLEFAAGFDKPSCEKYEVCEPNE